MVGFWKKGKGPPQKTEKRNGERRVFTTQTGEVAQVRKVRSVAAQWARRQTAEKGIGHSMGPGNPDTAQWVEGGGCGSFSFGETQGHLKKKKIGAIILVGHSFGGQPISGKMS